MFRLLATHGRDLWAYEVPPAEASLGRDAANDLVLPVRGVSRRHALVRRIPGGVEIVDLGSKNGLYVGGTRVTAAIVTPGLRVQIGEAWVELEELSSAEAELARLLAGPASRMRQESATLTISREGAPPSPASPELAARFFYYLDLVGVGLPGKRPEVLALAREHLGAESLVSVERRRRRLIVQERAGAALPDDETTLAALASDPWPFARTEVRLRHAGLHLLAGREEWFLAARFAAEASAREGWRRDLLRVLAGRFFEPARGPRTSTLEEVQRVFALTGGNVSETARRLGVQRPTIYKALARAGLRRKLAKPASYQE